MGAPRAKALCYCFGGKLDFLTGHFDEAQDSLHKAIEFYRDVGSSSGMALSLQALGDLMTAKGELEQAREVYNDGLVEAERAAMRSHCLTRLYASLTRNWLASDDIESAKTSMDQGLVCARRHGHCVTCNALILPEAVRVEVERGELGKAREFSDELEAIAGRFDSKLWRAMAHHTRARVLAGEGKAKDAKEALLEAKDLYLEVDRVYEAARCLKLAGEVLAGAKDKKLQSQAKSLAEEATQTFGQLGAPGVES